MSTISCKSRLPQDNLNPNVENKITYINDVLGNLFSAVQKLEKENSDLKNLVELLLHFKHMLLFVIQNVNIENIIDNSNSSSSRFTSDLEHCLTLFQNGIQAKHIFDYVQKFETYYGANTIYCDKNSFVCENIEKEINLNNKQTLFFDNIEDNFNITTINTSCEILDSSDNETVNNKRVTNKRKSNTANKKTTTKSQKSTNSQTSSVKIRRSTRLRNDQSDISSDQQTPKKLTDKIINEIDKQKSDLDAQISATSIEYESQSDFNQTRISVPIIEDHGTCRFPNMSLFFDKIYKNSEMLYHCTITNCNYVCNSRRYIVSHLYKHFNLKPYFCPQCSYRTEFKKNLYRHFRSTHKLSPQIIEYVDFYNCDDHGDTVQFICKFNYCDFVTHQTPMLISHLNWHFSQFPFKCPYCEQRFYDRNKCQIHIRVSHKRRLAKKKMVSKFFCPYDQCNFCIKTTDMNEMIEHCTAEHVFNQKVNFREQNSQQSSKLLKGKKVNKIGKIGKAKITKIKNKSSKTFDKKLNKQSESVDDVYSCSYRKCGFTSKSSTQVKAHEYRRHVKRMYKCSHDLCGVVCDDQDQLNEHMIENHPVNNYKCAIEGCDQAFPSSNLFKMHMQIDHKDTYLKCRICQKEFKTRSNMMRHFRMWHKEGQFACSREDCDYSASYRIELERHIAREHSRKKKCPVEGCGAVVGSTIYHLHINRHMKIKNYNCSWPECGKSFIDKKSLKDHIRIHLNFKRFKCKWPDCGYGSEQRANVIKHIRIRHFKLPYTKKQEQEMNISIDSMAQKPQDFLEVVPEDIEI